MTNTDRHKLASFCTRCFASDSDGSWGETVQGDHCFNCGAGGALSLPRWAVEEIRRNASWVGRHYYPNDEDRARQEEILRLRKQVTHFPGRSAAPPRLPDRSWVVLQSVPAGTVSILCPTEISSAEEALEFARTRLPYHDEESLAPTKPAPAPIRIQPDQN